MESRIDYECDARVENANDGVWKATRIVQGDGEAVKEEGIAVAEGVVNCKAIDDDDGVEVVAAAAACDLFSGSLCHPCPFADTLCPDSCLVLVASPGFSPAAPS